MAQLTYTVTVASGDLYGGGTGNVFYLDGARNSTGPGTVNWVNGATLRFDQSDSSNNNHPLIFSTNTTTSGIISSGVTYYLDGASNEANYTNTTTFNAASTRYIEVTPSSETDFYYLCYVHGIGMGGIFDITQNTWGALAWSDNAWGSSTNNIAVSSFSLTNSLGTPNIIADVNLGWGRLAWGQGEWNSSVESIDVQVSSFSLNSTTNSITIDGEINTGWGRLTWGENAWGVLGDVLLTGQSLNTNTGSVSIDSEVNVGWGRLTWGQNSWGSSTLSVELSVTGQALNTTTGTATGQAGAIVELDTKFNPGWGASINWGEQLWGTAQVDMFMSTAEGTVDPEPDVALTGQAMTMALNSVSVVGTASLTLTGQALSIAQGDENADAITFAAVTGQSLNTTSGTVFAGGTTEVDLTGVSMSMSTGTLSATIWTEIDPNVSMVWTEIAA